MTAFQTFFKSQMTFRAQDKVKKMKLDESTKREAYRQVDLRDRGRCRACKIICRRTLELLPDRLERHHYLFKSLGGKYDSANLITLCNRDHTEAQAHRLIITGHPDRVLTFHQGARRWQG